MTMTDEAPLLDYVTPIFYRTKVNAHGTILLSQTNFRKERYDFLSE